MGAPKAPDPPPDPMLQQLMKTAKQQEVTALQSTAEGDTASILARYGARIAQGTPAMGDFGGRFGVGGFASAIAGRGIGRVG